MTAAKMTADKLAPSRLAPVFCAIDTPDQHRANTLADQVMPHIAGLKVGMEFFYANGPDGVRAITQRGATVFLDLKLHDIPNTVAGAVRSLTPLQPAYMTVHTSGGAAMMEAARDAASETAGRLGLRRPRLLGVTVLTSLDGEGLDAVGQSRDPARQVGRLAVLARQSGLDGIVCSPWEIELVRAAVGPEMEIVVPGIRPQGSAAGDQSRVRTPVEAMTAGASWLVIGRPITEASNPAEAARDIACSILPQGA